MCELSPYPEQIPEADLETNQTSIMELFCENSKRLKTINIS